MRQGIMFNEDSDHFFHTRFNAGMKVGRGEIERFIDQYAGTQVSDFMICVTSRISSYPSKSRESLVDKYLQKIENGKPVDYSRTMAALAYDIFVTQGIDPYAVWIERLRAAGINPWISFRMNDCHCNAEETHWLLTDFYHENRHLRRVVHRPPDGYFDRCYDYGRAEIRDYQLAYIAETLERYDPYGIELDWQRELACFRPGGEYEGIAVLTRFMGEVGRLAAAAAKRRGHEIRIAARVHADPGINLEWGLDPISWARAGLVDVLVPTPRWETADTDIPVELWTRCLAGTGVALAPGVEVLLRTAPGRPPLMNTAETVAAQAAQYLSMGADRIYLFNYMDDPARVRPVVWDPLHPENGGLDYAYLLRIAGDEAAAVAAPRRHVVTYPDMLPPWRGPRLQLPAVCAEKGRYRTVRVRVGKVPAGAAVRLVVGAASGGGPLAAGDFDVHANSAPAAYAGPVAVRPAYTDSPGYAFTVPNDGRMPPFVVCEFATTGRPFTIDHVEIAINCPAPPPSEPRRGKITQQ